MPEEVQTQEMPMLDCRAAPVASSYNEEARTVDFVASTGARGLRRPYWGEDYYEELDISESAIRMDRLNNGAPFLNSHNQFNVSNVLGAVQRSWVENGQLMIRVKFSQRDDVAPILQDIRDGVLPHVSVGYLVHKYEVTEKQGELDVKRATDWEPMEVSLVPIGFDDAATVRASEGHTSQAVINRSIGAINGGSDMTQEVKKDQAPVENIAPDNEAQNRGASEESPAVDTRAIADEAIKRERERTTEIRRAVRAARLESDLADSLIEEGVSVDAARARIIDAIADMDTSEDVSAIRAVDVRTGVDHQVVNRLRDGITDALLFRAGISNEIGNGAEFQGMTLLRVCEELLSRGGISTRGMTPMQITSRALSTSDFVGITANTMNRSLLQGYESAPRTFVGLFRQGTAQDFRAIERVRLSGAPSLEEVKEGGEFKYGKVTDEKETYSLATYGKILPFTRQTIINDDMDALGRIPVMFGRAAADLESDIVWGIVTANAALQDGVALFHADHGNLAGAGAAISVTTVGAARAAMRAQTGMEGRLINVTPRHIIVGAAAETALDQFLTSITPDSQGNAIPQSMRSLQPVIEPRLSGNAWYLAADYMQVDTIEFSYLAGNQGVYLETQEGFDVDGIKVKARHDFAAKAIDYRGLYKNPGA